MNICKKFNLLAFLFVFYLCFFPASGNLDNFSSAKEIITMVDIQKNDDPIFFGMTEEEKVKVALAGSGTTINYRGVIATDVDGDLREELVVDFGSIGIWLYDPDSTPKWVVLYGVNPDFMVDVDFDGDGRKEIFAYFDSQNAIHKWDWEPGDPNGVWQWNYDVNHKCDYMFCAYIEDDGEEELVLGLKATDSSWYKMYVDEYDSNHWERTTAYDGRTYAAWRVDFAGAPEDEIVAYRQSMYLWEWVPPDQYWLDNWTSMTSADPDLSDTVVADFDADAEEELVVDILDQLWAYNYSSGTKWSRLNAATVLDIRAWPQVTGTDDELLVSFLSPNGLWMYDAQASPKWQSLNGLTPDYDDGFVEIFDADGDLDWDIAVDYSNQGIGLWKYDYNGSPKWTSMNGNSADYMVRADLDGDWDHELLVKFSTIAGLWKWDDDTTPKWQRINGVDPD